MHVHSYLQSAETILQLYDGSIPFASWLKNYFKQNKKFGSKDRKAIADLCFCFFRLGDAFSEKTVLERIIIGQFLCHTDSPFVSQQKQDWISYLASSIHEKLKVLETDEDISFFPFDNEVSVAIEKRRFNLSHLVQPDLFLRTRPGKEEAVQRKLNASSISFTLEKSCVRLANTSKIDEVIELDKDAVVQDKSSQLVLEPLKENWNRNSFTVWDCCAASGGKTILLHDLFPKAQPTVSDIRESILHNLRSRFRRAGIHQYQSFIADISSPSFQSNRKYDVIICDAPCSGSGTWGRTPEQLHFFKQERIDHYADLQKRIAVNASKSLNKSGMFVYITCSVFNRENEEVVSYISDHTAMQLITQRYFKGYMEKADTLFVALFRL